jgi:pimeloyl-ACP methyl ester carboxylesterase
MINRRKAKKKHKPTWVPFLVALQLVATPGLASSQDELGSFYLSDALVHYIRPDTTLSRTPIIMIPGLNLSSYIYLTTPDGRDGWAQIFAAAGHDVYAINSPDYDFARGGFSVAPFTVPAGGPPGVGTSAPAWNQDIWRRWGFGPSQGNPYPDTRFPTSSFAAFAANYPYVDSAVSPVSFTEAIIDLIDQVGPVYLMAHSAGGPSAVAAAKARPALVRALLMVEPTGAPVASDFPALAGQSMFGVYGDYIESRNQTNRKAALEASVALFIQNGGTAQVDSLPDDYKIFGNTHLMMQDNNNVFVAGLYLAWLQQLEQAGALFVNGFEAVPVR